MNRVIVASLACLAVVLFPVVTSAAENVMPGGAKDAPVKASPTAVWTQWRGANRDGYLPKGEAIPTTLAAEHFKQTWQIEVSPGYSTPIVTKNRVFTVESHNRESEVVRAFDRKTGKEVWKTDWKGKMNVPFFARRNGSWVRSSPAYDGKHLYVAGMRDVLVCLNAEDGEEVWRVDFTKRYGTALPAFGFVCSPMVVGNALYVQAGASFCKINAKTGETIWRTLVNKGDAYNSAFSSPILTTIHDVEQLVVQTRQALVGVDPKTGKTLWSIDIKAFRGMNILTPVMWKGNHIFTSTYGGGSFLVKVDKNDDGWNAKFVWANQTQGYMTSPVVVGDHAYLLLRKRQFVCIDLKTGKSVWESGRLRYSDYWSIVTDGKHILGLDSDGKLLVVKASPEKYEVLAEREVEDSDTWAHVVKVGDEVYVRSLKRLTRWDWAE